MQIRVQVKFRIDDIFAVSGLNTTHRNYGWHSMFRFRAVLKVEFKNVVIMYIIHAYNTVQNKRLIYFEVFGNFVQLVFRLAFVKKKD